MHRAVPATPAWWRLSALILGLVIFIWLPYEDTHERWVVLFAAALCTLATARFTTRLAAGQPGPRPSASLLRSGLVGAAGGLAVAPLAILLMGFKTGLHGHGVPDFTPEQIQRVLAFSPAWLAAGLLLGLGTALLRLARHG